MTTSFNASDDDVGELVRQAQIARAIGSPFVADVLEAGQRQLHRAPLTAAMLAHWQGDRAAAAVAMRFNAALHALARRDTPRALGALYRREHRDFDRAVGEALAVHDGFVADWMRHTPQTNEVGRAASLVAALMVVRRRFDLPVEVLELGSSAGLNLNFHRYAYDLGGVPAGDSASPVRIAPEWRGAALTAAPVELATSRGVDLHPLDAADPVTCERLTAFVFADQPARAERLGHALAMASRHVPRVDRANAADWLAERLRTPQPAGRCRVVFHSMVLQYIAADTRRTIVDTIARAGAQADPTRPLAWIGFEWTEDRSRVELRLTTWPDGGNHLLATCHPYGAWIDWQAIS